MSTSFGDPPCSHLEQLKLLCRLCGERIRKRKKRGEFSVEKYKDTLAKLGIDVAHDDPNVHPPSFCHLCCNETNATRVVGGKGKERRAKWKVVWNKHTDDGTCLSCIKAENSKKPGRPKLIKYGGRPRLGPAVAEERQKNQTRMPLPPLTAMTLRSRRKTRATEEIQNCPTLTTATSTAPISIAPGVDPSKAGYPKFRKLASKGAHESKTPITGTASANTEVGLEPQELRRFVLPSTLEKTIQINAFHNHDAEIKCKKCQKMIPLVNIDEHEFECVTPSLALHDHNYMFHGEKERRGRRKRKGNSGDQMPEAHEEEPLTDMVLIERSVLEELERRAKRNMQD